MKMKMLSGLLSLLVTSGLLAGELAIVTERHGTADFSSFHTFRWQEASLISDENGDAALAQRVDHLIREAVVASLEQKGFVRAEQSEPDFLVGYHMVLTGQAAEGTAEVAEGVGKATSPRGTILLYVLDARTHRILWQSAAAETAASATSVLNGSSRAVRSMMAHFPEA